MFGALLAYHVQTVARAPAPRGINHPGHRAWSAVFLRFAPAMHHLLDSLRATVEKLAGKATLQITAGESGFSKRCSIPCAQHQSVQLAETGDRDHGANLLYGRRRLLVLGVDTGETPAPWDYQFDRTQTQIADPLVFLG